ncbi:MAG TPA: hypothetical protein VGC10_03550 [Sphingomonas sp.]
MTFDIETVVDNEPADGSFPPWPRHKPVAAAFLSASWTPTGYEFDLETLINLPGLEPQFYQRVDALLPDGPVGISYNGVGFDLSVLRISAMAAGCFGLSGLARQAQAERFGSEHCDLADQFSKYGGTRRCSLAELCARLQIPVKTSTHGSEVGDLWRSGDIESIAEYVREDVVATYILWLHWSAFRAHDESRIILPLDDLATWLERTPKFAHLRAFAVCPPARWARARAPALRIARAQADAERRVQREKTERAFDREPAIF